MNILAINAGSTTIKYKLFQQTGSGFTRLNAGVLDKKEDTYYFKLTKENSVYEWEIGEFGFWNAGGLILKELDEYKIDKIVFRIVHGGEKYIKPTELTDEVIKEIEAHNDLAPLHNPPALMRIKQFKKIFPDVPFFGVFDTAFHQTMPEKAFLYAIPYEYYERFTIRRFGFHGISHKYVSNVFNKLEPDTKKIISCHLGGGASITAIQHGKSIDTSMGFTPLEGLIMSTRPGDIDDGAIHYLMDKMHFTIKDMQKLENEQSGLLGISGTSGDMRQLINLEKKGDKRAKLAIDMYIYRIQKYIGMYAASLGGVDGLIFTGGVGAGSSYIRKRIVEKLAFLGLKIYDLKNDGKQNVKSNLKISSNQSKPIWVVPTDEELGMVRLVAGD